MAARVGKIARLPLKIREELNRRLLEGQAASKILPWLNALPDTQQVCEEDFEGLLINDGNLSEWRKGGFAEWQRKRDTVSRTRELAAYSVELAKASGGNLTDGAAAMLSGQILEVLELAGELKADGSDGADGSDVAKRVAVMAEAIGGLTLSVARLRKGDIDRQQIDLNRDRLEQQGEALALERKRFQRQTCELFLQWAADRRATDVAVSAVGNAEKIERLGQLMFGEEWSPSHDERGA